MKKLTRRLVSMLLAVVMILDMVPVMAFATDGDVSNVMEKITLGDVSNVMEKITLGDFSVSEVGKTGISSSDVLLSQNTLISVPYCGAELYIQIKDDYQVRIHSGDNYNNIDQVSAWLNDGDVYTLPESSIYMRASIQRTDGGTITTSELENADINICYESDSNIITDNADTAQLLQNTDQAVIIHLSDIHGDTIRSERAALFAEYVGADALLASGDLTAYEPDDWGNALFEVMANYPDVNFVYGIGNHDTKVSANVYQETIYQSYFSQNPLTPDGRTYYYQDLADRKLRIISVNQQEGAATTTRGGTCYSQEQVDWLVDILKSTPAGYGVVLMYHSPETEIAEAIDPVYSEFFQTDNRYDKPTNSYSGYSGTFLMDLVDAFMLRKNFVWNYSEQNGETPVELNADFTAVADGVEFIAHVTGHLHSDSITYLPGTACKQLLLGVTCTNSMYGEPGGYYGLADYSDLNRVGNTSSQDAFNAYIIDRDNKTVRVVRIGAKQTTGGLTRDDMIIPYSIPFREGEFLFNTDGMVKLDMSGVEWVNYGIQAYGTEPTYFPGVRWSPDMIFGVPYDGVTFYVKVNAPYEIGIRSGETDTTMDTNYYWLNNKELNSGGKNRGYLYTVPEGHKKFTFSIANVSRDADNNIIDYTNTNLISSLELEAAGLEIWYNVDPQTNINYPFKTEDKSMLDMSGVEWVNYGIQAYGTEPAYLPGVRISPDTVFDVPYEGATFYIKVNSPYEIGIRSGETDTSMDVNYYWLNNKFLSSGDKDRGYVYTIPDGHTKFTFSVANVSRDSSGNVISNKNEISLDELDAIGLELWYVPDHTHSYSSTTTAPTCTQQGYTTYTCECGDSYVSDYVEAAGHTYKNGICTGCGDKKGAAISRADDQVYYDTLAEAMESAQTGDTVKLLADTETFMTNLYQGITLDLNGYTLETDYFVAFNGNNIIDSSEDNSGLLIVAEDRFAIANNSQLPVKTTDGYKFYEVLKINEKAYTGEQYGKYVFQPIIEPAVHQELLKGMEATDVQIIVDVTYKSGDDKTGKREFVYSDSFVETFVNSYNAETGKYGKMFTLTIGDASKFETLTFTTRVVFADKVEFASPLA